MGLYLLSANIYIRILCICLRQSEVTDNYTSYFKKEITDLKKYKDKIIRHLEISEKLKKNSNHQSCFEYYLDKFRLERISNHLLKYIDDFILELTRDEIDAKRRINYIIDSTNELVDFTSHQILQKVDEISTVYGKEIEFVRFSNVLFFTFEKKSTKAERNLGWKIFAEVKEDFIKYNSNISFFDIPMEQNRIRYGRFLCIKEDDIEEIFKLVYKFFIALKDYNLRIVLFPFLAEEYSITQFNINSNQDISTNFFFDKAAPIIDSLIKDFNQKELVLVREENFKFKIELPEYIKSKLNFEKDKSKTTEIFKPTFNKYKSFTYSFKLLGSSKNDVFISYSHKDSSIVNNVKDFLLNNGIKITIDTENHIAGGSIHQFITNSVKNTEITISFVSTNSIESIWVALESAYTLQLSNFYDKKHLVCLLDHKVFDPTYKLEVISMVDEKINNYKDLINISLEKKAGIEDYTDDLARYKNLRDNIDKIINHIKTHLAVDLSKGYSEEKLTQLVNAIKPKK
jgi:predicted  nucleic acid-binding Zn-ribbon protein